jgi:hypothetical protein
MIFRKTILLAYSAAALAVGAAQPAMAQQGEPTSTKPFGNHVMLFFKEATVRCGYRLEAGKPVMDSSTSGISLLDVKKTLTVASADGGRPSLMVIENFKQDTAQDAIIHASQKDKSWAARACTHDSKTRETTDCETTSPRVDQFAVNQTLSKAFMVCRAYFDKPGLKITPPAGETNSVTARMDWIRKRWENLRGMGFNIEVPKP